MPLPRDRGATRWQPWLALEAEYRLGPCGAESFESSQVSSRSALQFSVHCGRLFRHDHLCDLRRCRRLEARTFRADLKSKQVSAYADALAELNCAERGSGGRRYVEAARIVSRQAVCGSRGGTSGAYCIWQGCRGSGAAFALKDLLSTERCDGRGDSTVRVKRRTPKEGYSLR